MPRQKRRERPHALMITVGDRLLVQRTIFTQHGFQGSTIHSLLHGYTNVSHLLADLSSNRPTAILVDLLAVEPVFPALSGTLLVAALARAMRHHEIRPAWLIGMIAAATPEQAAEARVAGCHQLIPFPPTADALQEVYRLTQHPAPIPHQTDDPDPAIEAINAFQSLAQRMIETIQAAQAWPWTAEDVVLILRWLTPYPLPARKPSLDFDNAEARARLKRLLRILGGPQAARHQLEVIAGQWQHRYTLHGLILRKFLAGWERREIVRYFVDRKLYEDSRIYFCIKDLPRRIAEQLRRAR